MATYVRDLNLKDAITVKPQDSIRRAVEVMDMAGVHSVLMDTSSLLRKQWKIFTATDYMRVKSKKVDEEDKVDNHASVVRHFVTPDTSIDHCINLVATLDIDHLPVFTDKSMRKLVSVVSKNLLLTLADE